MNFIKKLGLLTFLFVSILSFSQEILQSHRIRTEPTTDLFYLHSGLYFGMILMLILVNLFFYLNLKDNIYLYYIFFIGATNFILAYHEGLLYPHIKNTLFRYDIDMFSHFFQLVVGFFFYRNFVNLRVHFKNIDTIFYTLVFGSAFVYLGYFINNDHTWILWADNIGISIFLSMWILSFFLYRKESYAKLISLAFGVVVVSGFFHITLQGVKLPIVGSTTGLIKIGNLLEAIILTYATTFRTKVLREENEQISLQLQNYVNQVVLLKSSLSDQRKKNTELSLENSNRLETIANDYELTERETAILFQIAKGLSNQQIADTLFISVNTVKYHIKNLYVKLDIKKRTEISSKLMFE